MEWDLWMSYLRSVSEYSGGQALKDIDCPHGESLNSLLDKVAYSHRWFTRGYLDFALDALISNAEIIDREFLISDKANGKRLGFWLRPLSPFDGLDLILLSLNAGYKCMIRTGETDAVLYKGVIELLEKRFPYLTGKTEFIDLPMGNVDARVIIGESPTTTQLEYFSKKPLFVDTISQYSTTAVLTGEETSAEIDALADNLCMFFGRSKYSISKLAVPSGYDFSVLLKSLERYRENGNHSGYFNHYEYRKAAYIVSGQPVIDNGFIIIKIETGESQSIGVVDYTEYEKGKMPEYDLKGRKISKATPEVQQGELAFGSACSRNFDLAGEFILFMKGI